MKKQVIFFLAVLLSLCLANVRPALAEEIKVLRGEEAETEVFLEGSEAVYSMLGELECAGEYVLLKNTKGENYGMYQVLEAEEDGTGARLLLSAKGEDNYGLRLRLRVEGKRIGTGTIRLAGLAMTDKNGEWLSGAELSGITVQVLPNPLEVSLAGEAGNNGWYTGTVTVTVEDKDAANIWYDTGEGKTEYTAPFKIYHGETELIVTSDDGYGYKKEETQWVLVDTARPKLTVSMEELSWQREKITVEAGASDSTSGLAWAFYAFSAEEENPGEWTSLNSGTELSMEQDGSWYLHLKAVDNAGNGNQKVYGPYRKDATAPEIVFENLQDGLLAEEGILPEITVTDACSGIKEITYLLDGKTWNKEKITEKGIHTLTVTATDLAGNTKTETVEFSIYDRIQVTASASDCHYTGTASCSALVAYGGEPLPDTVVEFFINGESMGTRRTGSDGVAWLHFPVDLAPQKAELTVCVAQDDERFLLAAGDRTAFTVRPEKAWLKYTGDYHVWYGEPLRIRLEMGEFHDFRRGDITRAEVLAELYLLENDGSRTLVDEVYLSPDERGTATHEFYPDTGLYELVIRFTEESCYTGQEIILHPAVFHMDAELGWEGGSLLLDLPQVGIYVEISFTFLPPSLEAEINVRVPGTDIVLTENKITGYDLKINGLTLYGTAVNPADGTVYSYEIRSGYTLGIFLDELEISMWKGEDKAKEPAYHFMWSAEEFFAEE